VQVWGGFRLEVCWCGARMVKKFQHPQDVIWERRISQILKCRRLCFDLFTLVLSLLAFFVLDLAYHLLNRKHCFIACRFQEWECVALHEIYFLYLKKSADRFNSSSLWSLVYFSEKHWDFLLSKFDVQWHT